MTIRVRNSQQTLLWLLVMYKNTMGLWLPKPIIEMVGSHFFDLCSVLHSQVRSGCTFDSWQWDVANSIHQSNKVVVGMHRRAGSTFIACKIAKSMVLYYPKRRVIYMCTGEELSEKEVRVYVGGGLGVKNICIETVPILQDKQQECYLLILDRVFEYQVPKIKYEKLLRITLS